MSYELLGIALKSARLARGLELAFIARIADVREQAVRNWERGSSRPTLKALHALAESLNLEVEDLRRAGQYDRPPQVPRAPALVVSLPFEDLDERTFEMFCRDLFIELYPKRSSSLNGSSGHKQFGVDVFVTGEEEHIGIQCKRHQTFGPADVNNAVAEVLPAANITRGIIALSRKTATPDARRAVKTHPGWELWDGEDLSSRVRGLSADAGLRLVDSYFRGWRETFLGVSRPSPWLGVTEFLPPLAGKLAFEGDFALTGRESELSELQSFVGRGDPVIFVVGRGGIGKTRLLAELGRTQANRQVRYGTGDALTREAFDLLPPGDPIVVFDDAAEADKRIPPLIKGVRTARPDATVVLATRPSALPELLVHLDVTEADASTVTVDVQDLTNFAAEQLAALALKEAASEQTVEALALIGYDCPLMIMVGAHLIRHGDLQPTQIGASHELRERILTAFVDVAVRGAHGEHNQATLDAVAALQPARLDQPEFETALLELSGLNVRTLHNALDRLEELSLILRNGQSVRVVPDLLGEAVLERALVSRSGSDKQVASSIARSARGTALTNAIRNVSVVDWRRRSNHESALADVLWSALSIAVIASPNTERKRLASAVAAVASIHPDRALEFARTILAHPAADESDPISTLWGGTGLSTHEECKRSIAPLIRNAAHRDTHLEEAMRLLRDIGAGDDRQPARTSDHAYTLLKQIGEYSPGRSRLSDHKRYATEIAAWLREYPSSPHRGDWLLLFDPLLAQHVDITRSRGASISFGRADIDINVTSPVRRIVVDIAAEHLTSTSTVALQAVQLLDRALRSGGRDEPINDEFSRTVDILTEAFTSTAMPASIRLAAFRALGWHAKFARGPRRDVARSARRKIVWDADLIVVRMASNGRFGDDEDTESDSRFDLESIAHQRTEQSETVLREWSEMADAQVLSTILNLLRIEREPQGHLNFPNELIETAIAQRPGFAAIALAQEPITDPVIASLQAVTLGSILDARGDGGFDEAFSLIGAGAHGALIAIDGVMRARSSHAVRKRATILRRACTTRDESVHFQIARALRTFSRDDRELVVELLMDVSIDRSAGVAEEAAATLIFGRAVGWAELSAAQRSTFIDRLKTTPRLSGYSVGELLSAHLKVEPMEVLDLLIYRVDRPSLVDDFEPLPDQYEIDLQFFVVSALPRLLERLIDWLKATDEDQRYLHGHRLFEIVAGPFNSDVSSSLIQLICSGDGASINLAGELLRVAPSDFVIRNVPFVEQSLTACESYPEEWTQLIVTGLQDAGRYHVRSRSVGVDDPATVQLRDEAFAIAEHLPLASSARRFYEEVANSAAKELDSDRSRDRGFGLRRREW